MIINLLNPVVSGVLSEDVSDRDIIDRYLETQDGSYFSIIYDRYSRLVYAKCLSMLKNEVAAEDAVQEIFIKVMLKLSSYTGDAKFSTWMYAITYNYCIDVIRKTQRKKTIDVEDIGVLEASMIHEPDDARILEVDIKRLKYVLERIPRKDKAILMMKYLEEFSIKEIAEIMEKSESAVKMQIFRAKEKFLKKYEEAYSHNKNS